MGQTLDIPAKEIFFQKNEYGKLSLSSEYNNYQIDFNLSHSIDLVVCVISTNSSIGIDIEKMTKNYLGIMPIVFTEDEIHFVNSFRNIKKKLKAFYLIWTRKEALLKAKGKGFFLQPKEHPVPLVFSNISDNGHDFYLIDIEPCYMCSLVTSNETKNTYFNITTTYIDFKDLFNILF